MEIAALACDICDTRVAYPDGVRGHGHPEAFIGGVPMNIWTPEYSLCRAGCLPVREEEGVFRFADLLPAPASKMTLGEGGTCLMPFESSLEAQVFLKYEGSNPTGSFKDRGMPLLLDEALRSGARRIALPSTGNAAASLARYAPLAGIEPLLFVPKDTPESKMKLIDAEKIIDRDLVTSFEHCFAYCARRPDIFNGFPALSVGYGQGMKTLAYEMFLQLDGVPDWVVVPCGSGSALIGLHHGFSDIVRLGLASGIPRFVSVQAEGADPLTMGYALGQYNPVPVISSPRRSRAEAIASDTCLSYHKAFRILESSRGLAISVTDEEIWGVAGTATDLLEFSSRSVVAALPRLENVLAQSDKVVLVGTAARRR